MDKKEYPPNWDTEIRPAVLKRANNCCENCGVKNHAKIYRYGKGLHEFVYYPDSLNGKPVDYTAVKLTTVVLTIAHLDHDKHNHEVTLDRLRAWCQKCHLWYDLKRHIANRRYGRNHLKHQGKLF